MIQFADELKDMYITDTLGGGWSDAVFHKVTRGAFETRISGQYDNTHGAVDEVVRRWNSMTPSRRKALLVLFTDGAIDKPEAVSIGKVCNLLSIRKILSSVFRLGAKVWM